MQPDSKHITVVLSGSTLLYKAPSLIRMLQAQGFTVHVEATPRAYDWLCWHDRTAVRPATELQKQQNHRWIADTFPRDEWPDLYQRDGVAHLQDLTGYPVVVHQRVLPGADKDKVPRPDVIVAFGASMGLSMRLAQKNGDGNQAVETSIDYRAPRVIVPFSTNDHVNLHWEAFEKLEREPGTYVLLGPSFMPLPKGGTQRIRDWPMPLEAIVETTAAIARGEKPNVKPIQQVPSSHAFPQSAMSSYELYLEQAKQYLTGVEQVLRKPSFDDNYKMLSTEPVVRSTLPATLLALWLVIDNVLIHPFFPFHFPLEEILIWKGAAKLSNLRIWSGVSKALDKSVLPILDRWPIPQTRRSWEIGTLRRVRDYIVPRAKTLSAFTLTTLESRTGRLIRGASLGGLYVAAASLFAPLSLPVVGLLLGIPTAVKVFGPYVSEHSRFREQISAPYATPRKNFIRDLLKKLTYHDYGPEEPLPDNPNNFRGLTMAETIEGVAKLLEGKSGSLHRDWGTNLWRLHRAYRLSVRVNKDTGEQLALRRSSEASGPVNLTQAWMEVDRCIRETTGGELSRELLQRLTQRPEIIDAVVETANGLEVEQEPQQQEPQHAREQQPPSEVSVSISQEPTSYIRTVSPTQDRTDGQGKELTLPSL